MSVFQKCLLHAVLFFVFLLFFKPGQCQSIWADSCTVGSFYGNITVATGFSFFQKVHEYPGGDLIAAGGIRSDTASPNFTLPTVYGLLARINTKGDLLWSKFIGFDKSDYGSDTRITASTLTANGDIVVVTYNESGLAVEHGGSFVVRLDGNGNPRWKKRIPYNFLNNLNEDIIETSDGGLLICGFVGSAYTNAFVCKLNANGDLLWAHQYAHSGPHTYCRSVVESPNAYYFSGFSHEFASQATQNILVKLDKQTGNVIWAKSFLYATESQGQTEYFFDKMTYRNGVLTLVGGTSRIYSGSNPPAQATISFDEDGQFTAGQRITVTNVSFDRVLINKGSRFDPYAKIGVQYEYLSATGDVNVFRLNNDNSVRWAWRLPTPNTDEANESLVLSDSSLAVVGTNGVPATNAVLLRTAPDGRLENCDNLPTTVRVAAFNTTVSNFSLDANPYITDSMRVSQIAVQNGARFSWNLICKAPVCKLSKIAGVTSVCAGKTAVYRVSVVGNCKGNVAFTADGNSVIQRLTDTSVSIVFASAGKQVVYARLPGSCRTLVDSLIVDVQQGVKTLDLGSDRELCPKNSLVLNAHSGYISYLWQDGSTDSTYTVTQPGLYHVTATDACGGISKDSVMVTTAPLIPFSAGQDRTKCNSDTVQLAAPPGFLTYTWSNDYNISSLTSQSVVVNPLVDTAYYIKAEKTPGCFAYDTIRVSVHTSPPIDLGADRSFCFGDSAVVSAGAGFQSYAWSNGEVSHQVVLKSAGKYSVVATTTEGCKSYDTVSVVNVYPLPRPHLEQNISLCKGESKTLQVGNFAAYEWSTGEHSPSITVDTLGTYFVAVTDNHGCTGSDATSVIAIKPLPAGFLPSDTALCSYDKLELKPVQNFKTYWWSTGESAPSITVTQPGLYWLQVQDENNCQGKDSITVFSRDCMSGFFVPNAFTPNDDGKNDLFRPRLFGNVKKYVFTIYNRWGQAVFQTTDPAKGWDGRVAGIPQESNAFVWTCTYQFEGEAVQMKKGTLTIVR